MPRDSRYDFDGPRFLDEAQKACRGLGITMKEAARALGLTESQFSRIASGSIPNGRALTAICAYLGLDAREFLIDFDDPKIPKLPPHVKRWSFKAALERIKELEEELKQCTTKI